MRAREAEASPILYVGGGVVMDQRTTTARRTCGGPAASARPPAALALVRILAAAILSVACLLGAGPWPLVHLAAASPSAGTPAEAATGPLWTPGPASRTCPLFLLRRGAAGLRVELDRMDDGSIEAIPLGEPSDIVAILVPSVDGVGHRMFLARPSGASATVHCARDSLSITYRGEPGRTGGPPSVSLADLRGSQVQITVLGDGMRRGYLLREGRLLAPDPVVRPRLPDGAARVLGPDRILVASAARTRPAGTVTGTLPIHRVGPYLTGTVTIPGGGTGDAILDLGANRTTLSTSILAMASGARMTPAALQLPHFRREEGTRALGGEISRVGAVQVAGLRVGGIDFRDAAVVVLEDLPSFDRHAFVGVVGTDLLGRADVVRIHMPRAGRDGSLELLSEAQARDSRERVTAEVPFVQVAGLIVIPGEVGGRIVPLVLDTGSPATLVTPDLASDLGLFPVAGQPTLLSGLDGTAIPAWPDTLRALDLGGARFDSVPAAVAVLPVLTRIGLPRRSILLGQSFLARIEALEVDWRGGVVRFYR